MEKYKLIGLIQNKMGTEDKLFIQCECSSEVLVISYEDDYIAEDDQVDGPITHIETYDLAIFKSLRSHQLSWRIKMAWRLLFRGEYFTDQICLSKEKALQIKDFIAKQNSNVNLSVANILDLTK